MHSFDFFRKNKKALKAAVGLTMACISIVLLTWVVVKGAAGKSQEALAEIPENEDSVKDSESSTTKPSVKPQMEQSSEQEAEPTPELVFESQVESIEGSESAVEPEPVLTAEYELIYEGISLFDVFEYAAFKDMNTHADLYMRRLQDDTEEYVELSLWSDQKEIWYTINGDSTGDYDLFYWEHSECLTLDQKQCYYVVPLDGTVYLMRYCVETASDTVTMSYKVFGVNPMIPYSFRGGEEPFDVGSITVYLVSNGSVGLDVSFPIKQMMAFADTVKGYMENGFLAASTLHSVFEFDSSADRDNPVSPYPYDVFPWLPELAAKCGVNTESIHSTKEMLTALQDTLPTDTSAAMPDADADGTYFITGDYYSDSDESYLTVRLREDGSYGGHLLIDNALNMDFIGNYENGILTAKQTDNYSDCLPYEIEIFFRKGKATVTITAADEEYFIKVGETLTVDRNEKPKGLEVMRNAEPNWTE